MRTPIRRIFYTSTYRILNVPGILPPEVSFDHEPEYEDRTSPKTRTTRPPTVGTHVNTYFEVPGIHLYTYEYE